MKRTDPSRDKFFVEIWIRRVDGLVKICQKLNFVLQNLANFTKKPIFKSETESQMTRKTSLNNVRETSITINMIIVHSRRLEC